MAAKGGHLLPKGVSSLEHNPLCGDCERLYDVAAPVLSGVNHLHYEQANGLRSREGGGRGEKTVKLLITSLQPVFMSCLEIKEVFSKLCFHLSVGTSQRELRYN